MDRLCLREWQWTRMVEEVERLAPEEACGLLAGNGSSVEEVIPVTNALHSRVRFRMDPVEQLKAFQQIDERGWELVGIYHSHPHGPERPSQTDIQEAYYPEAVYLIFTMEGGEWHCQGFLIRNGTTMEVDISIIPDRESNSGEQNVLSL